MVQGRASGRAPLSCLALVLALLLVSARPAVADPWRWGAAGDSLTRRNPFTYPAQVADADHDLHNVALGGSRVWDFIDEQVPRILRLGCTVVTVSIGTNDVMQPSLQPTAPVVTPADYARLMDWAVAVLQFSDPRRQVILGTVPPLEMYPGCRSWPAKQKLWARDMIASYNRSLAEIAARRHCRHWTFPTVAASLFQSDGFHPDAAGNRVVADSLRPLLPRGPGPAPRPWTLDAGPITFFPESGPAGTVISIRGQGMDDVKRVVWFTGPTDAEFAMCPVLSRAEECLTCVIPARARGDVHLWLMRQPAVTRRLPSVILGTFRVTGAPAASPATHTASVVPAGGVWLGVLKSPQGRETALRMDMDQAGVALKGRALLVDADRVRRLVVTGLVQGRAVDCTSQDGWRFAGRLTRDGRLIQPLGGWSGTLRRW